LEIFCETKTLGDFKRHGRIVNLAQSQSITDLAVTFGPWVAPWGEVRSRSSSSGTVCIVERRGNALCLKPQTNLYTS
jgi:hypothetical protein